MNKQFKVMTRGGRQYRITTRDPDSDFPILGEVEEPGFRIPMRWTENGNYNLRGESVYDLMPIEPEAPSLANLRVDLALAACSLRAVVVEYQRAEDAKDKAGEALFNAFVASGKTDVVVKIDGDYYYFFASESTARFRKIEVL